jgi:hypothetical protein
MSDRKTPWKCMLPFNSSIVNRAQFLLSLNGALLRFDLMSFARQVACSFPLSS